MESSPDFVFDIARTLDDATYVDSVNKIKLDLTVNWYSKVLSIIMRSMIINPKMTRQDRCLPQLTTHILIW